MTITVGFGDSAVGYFMLSTTFTGSGTSATEDGTVYYLVTTDVDGAVKNMQKRKVNSSGIITTSKDGKRDASVKVKGYVGVWTGQTNRTTNFNTLKAFLDTKMLASAALFYVFLKTFEGGGSGTYVKLGSTTSYLKVTLSNYTWKLEDGNNFSFDLSLDEATY